MSEPFLAELRIFSFNFPPKGWAFCNGQLLPINQNQALFSILGTTYGGDGRVNFALPNLQGKVPMHVGNNHVLGETAGEPNHTLISSEMPVHTHVPACSSGNANVATPVGNVWAAVAGQNAYAASSDGVALGPQAVGAGGGSQPHNNMQPYLVLTIAIALAGIFPSRN